MRETAEDRPEPEQVAFFDRAHAGFLDACKAVGENHFDIRLAGTTIRLLFAGDSLFPWLTTALAHLAIAPVERPDATFCIWESLTSGVDMPPPPVPNTNFTDRGDIWGLHSRRIKTAFHYHDFSVNLFDHDRSMGIYWVRDARALPYWVGASPLRTLLHWWMERHGCQLVHAAAVGTDAGAVLITGRGGVGKSTTALACLEAGLFYLADDYVVVRHEGELAVHSLYCTAKLNGPDVERFPGLRDCLSNAERAADEKAVLFLLPRFAGRLRPALPLRAVAIPRVSDSEDTVLLPADSLIVQQAASFTTMSQLPHVGRQTHEFFGRLCSELPTFTLRLGRRTEEIPRAIAAFLDGQSAAPARTPLGTGIGEAPGITLETTFEATIGDNPGTTIGAVIGSTPGTTIETTIGDAPGTSIDATIGGTPETTLGTPIGAAIESPIGTTIGLALAASLPIGRSVGSGRGPLISVVIPVWNGERFLGNAVESVLAQGYPSIEIIIVDDGSTDATEGVVRGLRCEVRYFRQENAGPAAARNRGIRDSSGELIAFLDVDDLWPENSLRAMADEMVRDPGLEVVRGHAQLLVRDPLTGEFEYRGSPTESFPDYIGAGLYRKRVFGQVGMFDTTLIFGEDVDWYNRARERRAVIKRLDAVTLFVRRHGGNMTHGKDLVGLNALRVFKKSIDRKRVGGAAEAAADSRP